MNRPVFEKLKHPPQHCRTQPRASLRELESKKFCRHRAVYSPAGTARIVVTSRRGDSKGGHIGVSPFGVFFFCHFFLHKQKEMAHNLSGIYRRRGNPFSPPGAIFFLRSQKEYGKKNLPREGLVETAPPLEPTPVCISSHRHMPGDAFAAYCGGTQEML